MPKNIGVDKKVYCQSGPTSITKLMLYSLLNFIYSDMLNPVQPACQLTYNILQKQTKPILFQTRYKCMEVKHNDIYGCMCLCRKDTPTNLVFSFSTFML